MGGGSILWLVLFLVWIWIMGWDGMGRKIFWRSNPRFNYYLLTIFEEFDLTFTSYLCCVYMPTLGVYL